LLVKGESLWKSFTNNAGLLVYRELDEALRLTEMAEDVLTNSRLGTNKQRLLMPLLQQSLYSRYLAVFPQTA